MSHAVLSALGLSGRRTGTYLGNGEWSKTTDAGTI
jgi:aldehyde dehydrogenase (NAD+)